MHSLPSHSRYPTRTCLHFVVCGVAMKSPSRGSGGTRRGSRWHLAIFTAAVLGWLAPAHGADGSCAVLAKAVRAGMAQPRIHTAIAAPLDAEAVKAGMKPTLMHSIVIDQVQHSNALSPTFRRVALASTDQRDLATDLAASKQTAVARSRAANALPGEQRRSGHSAPTWAAGRLASRFGWTPPAACRCAPSAMSRTSTSR